MRNQEMYRALLFTGLLLLASPVLADLGSAELEDKQTFVSETNHDAFCKVFGNKCIVTFKDGLMKVDGSTGIDSSQIISVKREPVPTTKTCILCSKEEKYRFGSDEFLIKYTRDDGSIGRAKFLYIPNSGGGDKLERDLEEWLGQPLREIGPSIKIEK